jgi:hypothetical protein
VIVAACAAAAHASNTTVIAIVMQIRGREKIPPVCGLARPTDSIVIATFAPRGAKSIDTASRGELEQ